MFDTPILLICFNRPVHTSKVLAEIKKLKPNIFFVFRDGPRKNIPEDYRRCNHVKNIIMDEVDWECSFHPLFERDNLGCGLGPSKAISWFFNHVEEGIVLEDDCFPIQSFFPYCEELLQIYRNDNRIYMISGFNPLNRWKDKKGSYIFTPIANSLGWATWKNRWSRFDYDMNDWRLPAVKESIRKILSNKKYYDYYSSNFDKYHISPQKDVWDFQWAFTRYSNGGYSIVPTVNLIKNIGFDREATHTKNSNDSLAKLEVTNIQLPLKHEGFKIDHIYTWLVFEKYRNNKKKNILQRIAYKAIRIFYGLK